ncbi:MAG: creatininase family protein [Gammaproteobacteria bacterium]|jgi:creatinine amidohydrolase|nr:creatininase family protein [Gammaproteobacteria bacterium]
MPKHWAHLTSRELDALASREPVAALVLGAIEQHGPHLPLATDCIIGEALLAAAAAQLEDAFPLLVLPTFTLGASEEHARFAGTLSCTAGQLHRQLLALGEGLSRSGLRRLVLVNAHGGNIGWMESGALALRRAFGMLVVKASYMRFAAPVDLVAAEELRDGLHGGLAETAMMRHLAGELVHMAHAEDFVPRHRHDQPLPPQGEAPWAWLAEDLHEAGVVGDAASATAELGEKLVAHYAGRLADVIRACRDKPWQPVDGRGR